MITRTLILLLLLISSANYAQINEAGMFYKEIKEDSARLVDIYKDIHANPELGFMETRTAGIIEKELKSLGYTVKTGIGVTGVVGVLKNGEGPVVMYRADMDCNAVKETTGLPYASTKVVKREDGSETPVMHACGHDAHVTWLLGIAKLMAAQKDIWKGTLVMVGQPAEEPIMGAEAMVNDGMYSRHGVPEPDYLFGMHTAPIGLGLVAAASGVRMAGTDQIDIIFHGVGGHGSTPQLTKDPVVMAAAAVMQYQAIVSRGIDPKNSAVITVGSIQAGSDNNVIPSSALLKVNLRWFSDADRQLMIQGIRRINEGIARAYNLPEDKMPEMKMKGWSVPLDNDPEITKVVQEALQQLVDDKYILKEDRVPSIMGSEDFHHLVIHNTNKKYCYINIGTAPPERYKKALEEGKQLPFGTHNGDFVVDLAAIPFGTRIGSNALLAIFTENK